MNIKIKINRLQLYFLHTVVFMIIALSLPTFTQTITNFNLTEEKIDKYVNDNVCVSHNDTDILESISVEESKLIPKAYLDIPLTEEIQSYTQSLCAEYNLQPELVFAIMSVESNFNPNTISKTNDYGLMQINKINHERLREKYGVTDFLNPEQNILCGVVIISELCEKYEDIHKTLMAYNMGEGGAKKCWNNGIYTSKYSRKVVKKMEEYVE